MNKTGGHVGIVFSFIIFITFLVFVYDALAPAIQTTEGKENILKDIKEKITEQFYSNMTVTTIKVLTQAGQCIGIDKDDISSNYDYFLLRNIDGSNVMFSQDGDTLLVPSIKDEFFEIFSSNEYFISGDTPCSTPASATKNTEYEISFIRPQQQIFSSRIEEFIEGMKDDLSYQSLKDTFAIPIDSEFSVSFEYDNKSKIGGTEKEIPANIYVDKVAINYIDSEANIKPGFVEFMVW